MSCEESRPLVYAFAIQLNGDLGFFPLSLGIKFRLYLNKTRI